MSLDPDRCFDPDPRTREIARGLYQSARNAPLICPHGHVDPAIFSDPDYHFGSPAELFIIPDHYVFRMLYSQGIPLHALGVPARDGRAVENDHRRIWRLFAEHLYLFRGTPTGLWLQDEFASVFGLDEPLNAASADRFYDHISDQLRQPAFRPRALYQRFNIEVLATTDAAADDLSHHRAVRASGWNGRIIPTFRPDAVVNLDTPGWRDHIAQLGAISGIEISGYHAFITALEQRRADFRAMGAVATDHSAASAHTERLSPRETEVLFQRALRDQASAADAARFTGHMLIEMARMSAEDGLVMQLHIGSYRNHSPALFAGFGADKGADIPTAAEWTRALKPLLDRFGAHPNLRLILFTLDEAAYSRELAPLAGVYPALRLGPPWWFHDSYNGMRRYFDQIMETAGLYNTAGFNDDTRAFLSIPARHDVWRRTAANWLAGLRVRGLITAADATDMMAELAYGLAKRAYRL